MRVDLKAVFGKFAGREVRMEKASEDVVIRGVTKRRATVMPADENDPVFREMEQAAQDNGLSLRVLWPGKGYTDDYKRTRVNAHIEKGTDGKWRVSPKFDVG